MLGDDGAASPPANTVISLIVDSGSWRWIFYVNIPICLIALMLARRGIPGDGPREHGGRWLDLTGLALLAPALAGIAISTLSALAYTQVGMHTDDLILGVSLLAWGMGVAAVAVPVSAAAYEGLAPTAIPSATSTITTVQTVGASVGAAVLATILQGRTAHHHGTPAAAFADTFWWVLAFTLLTLIPAMLLPLRHDKSRAQSRTEQ